MSSVLDPKTGVVLGDLQPELQDDPTVRAALDCVGRELARIEAAARALRDAFFPALSDDTHGVLSLYERIFGLPVAQAGQTLEQRRSTIIAHFRKRVSGSGADWEAALTLAMGTTEYAYREGPGGYTVTITYPFVVGGLNSAAVQSFAREITPAHLQLVAGYTSGFLIGISLIGDVL